LTEGKKWKKEEEKNEKKLGTVAAKYAAGALFFLSFFLSFFPFLGGYITCYYFIWLL